MVHVLPGGWSRAHAGQLIVAGARPEMQMGGFDRTMATLDRPKSVTAGGITVGSVRRLLSVPPSFFSISMGLAGLADAWRTADSELQPYVRESRAAIARLQAGRH